MNITAESYGHAVILKLTGELTEDSLNVFRDAVDHHLGARNLIDLVLDMESVSFIDSVALEYLVGLQDSLAEKLGQVRLVRPDDNIRKILEITRLESTFEVFANPADALKSISV